MVTFVLLKATPQYAQAYLKQLSSRPSQRSLRCGRVLLAPIESTVGSSPPPVNRNLQAVATVNLSKPTGMILDGVAASQAVDSSGEVLDVEGCDISSLPVDGTINYEHIAPDGDDEKKPAPGEETVGKILFAKKIFGADDCASDRELMYWKKVKLPYIYIVYRLFDGAGHRGAQALAAAIRDAHANGEQILVRLSIEGSTLDRDPNNKNRLTSSVARRVSATWKPCNRTCDVGVLADPNAPEGFDKTPLGTSEQKDLLAGLIDKAERPLHQHPAYRRLGASVEVEYQPFSKAEEVLKTLKLIAKQRVLKSLTAGNYNVAPSALSGGAALSVEDRSLRGRMRKAVHGYKPAGPFSKAEFKTFAKACLPEADDSFLDHFADVAEDYHLRRLKKVEALGPGAFLRKVQEMTIDLRKAAADLRTDHEPAPQPAAVGFAGRRVVPGHARTAAGDYALLDEHPDHYVAVPQEKLGKWGHQHVVRFPKAKENTHFAVTRHPAVLVQDLGKPGQEN